MGGQQVQRPGQGRGRGFVPRQKEDRHLVDHFRGGERLARLRVGGRHDLGGKIVGRGAGPDLGHARGGHSGDQFTDPAGRRPGPGAVAARHPARQGQERAGIQDGLRALIGAKGVEDLVCHVIVDRHREKRAEDHVRCRVAHLGLDLHLAPGQTRHRRQTRRPHRRQRVLEPPPFEGRVDDAALPEPGLAIGQKHRIAQKRAKPLAHAVGFRKIHRACLQHRVDQVRLVDQVGPEERRAVFGHPGAVEPRGLRRQDILPEQADIAPGRHAVGARGGFGRQAGHGPTERWRFTGRSIRPGDGARPA